MRANLMPLVLLLMVLATAVGVVVSKHESRKLFVELQGLQSQRDDMNIEWGQLQLEQSTWATHGRVERIAGSQLGMSLPPRDEVVIVRHE